MVNVTAKVQPEDRMKITVFIKFDCQNLSVFVRAKVRERYDEFAKRRRQQNGQ